GNLALGAVDDLELTERVAAAIAGDLARAGIGLDLAPVADANTNPRNPIVGVRAFGSDPELVARHVAAFVRGMQACRVAACAKHFPGHGDTSADSHLELPRVEGDLEAALVPFRAAVVAGVRAVMTGHLLVPALDDVPATISSRIVHDLLRGELGFTGLVVTDALEMRAISAGVGVEEGAVRALAAGVDALCLGHDLGDEAVDAVRRAIVEAVREGRLTEERLAEAAARVEATARWATGGETGGRDAAVGAEAARRALRVEGDTTIEAAPLVVELAPQPTIAAGPAGFSFAEAARRAWPGAETVRLGAGDPEPELDGRPLVLVLRDAGRHEWQQRLAAKLLAAGAGAIVVETGLPGTRPAGAAGYVTTFGASRASLLAAVEALQTA
ncbi:MAG TPA: glycoside hydrolase family 3 N-terminal domain-containing protein, partial [Gaiellaceae bacterium]|nr:glycoside hydrolase family 3 N-terminal domain-containing protein [Gaiellaceae bacterium]